jgi:hypothetical protein
LESAITHPLRRCQLDRLYQRVIELDTHIQAVGLKAAAPDARATGVGLFSAAVYIGQPVGVSLVALLIDRFGATPVIECSSRHST